MKLPITLTQNEFKKRLQDKHPLSFRRIELDELVAGLKFDGRPFYVDPKAGTWVFRHRNDSHGSVFIRQEEIYRILVQAGRIIDSSDLSGNSARLSRMDLLNGREFSTPISLPGFPKGPGVFILVDETGKCLFVGAAKKLSSEISKLINHSARAHRAKSSKLPTASEIQAYQEKGRTVCIRFHECSNYAAVALELMKELKPAWSLSYCAYKPSQY